MGKLRVLIVSAEGVVDVQEFDDPRLRYVQDFNQLNQLTPYTAVLQLPAEAVSDEAERAEARRVIRPHRDACRPHRNCRESG